jgi:hypothetical protein
MNQALYAHTNNKRKIKKKKRIILKTYKYTHRCFDVGMPKNVNLSTHVWTQKK